MLYIVFLIVFGFAAYVRLAPSNPETWHVARDIAQGKDFASGVQRVVDDETLERLDGVIRVTPRTTVLAGSPREGMITYITRSAIFGFPDYTTVHQNGARVEIYARLRFGRSDLGVNGKRVDAWLAALR